VQRAVNLPGATQPDPLSAVGGGQIAHDDEKQCPMLLPTRKGADTQPLPPQRVGRFSLGLERCLGEGSRSPPFAHREDQRFLGRFAVGGRIGRGETLRAPAEGA
jgi:hypothetical protein